MGNFSTLAREKKNKFKRKKIAKKTIWDVVHLHSWAVGMFLQDLNGKKKRGNKSLKQNWGGAPHLTSGFAVYGGESREMRKYFFLEMT